MKLQLAAAFTLTLAIPFQTANALANTPSRAPQSADIVLKLSDLRSAYLIRSGVVHYDANATSPAQLRAQLQRHFDVVIGLLLLSTRSSIETAVARLEGASDHAWSKAERADWRHKLVAMRYVQLQRLAAYRDRGLFPLNEGQANHPVPIFVDAHDTACAVGQLMRWSGWEKQVANIHHKSNLVYVPDAIENDVGSWTLTSGLIWEEAALVQPAYGWTGEDNAALYGVGGLALERSGLRFENFQLTATNYTATPSNFPPEACAIVPEVCVAQTQPTGGAVPTLDGLGLLTRKGFYASPPTGFAYPQHTPNGTHFLAIAGYKTSDGAQPTTVLHALGASADEGRAQKVVIQFDVSAIGGDAYINQIAESSYLYQSGFYDPAAYGAASGPAQSTFHLQTTAKDGAATVASLLIDQTTTPIGYWQKTDVDQFTPRKKITIQSEVWVQDGVGIGTYLLDFNVITVPEPTSTLIAMIGLMGICAGRFWRPRV